ADAGLACRGELLQSDKDVERFPAEPDVVAGVDMAEPSVGGAREERTQEVERRTFRIEAEVGGEGEIARELGLRRVLVRERELIAGGERCERLDQIVERATVSF